MIATETATVYRGGGRRWFTKRAACRAEARARMKRDCGCDYCDHESYGREHLPCARHADAERYTKMLRRLTRLYLAAAIGEPTKPEGK